MFSHSVMSDSVTPWTAAQQTSLSFSISKRLLKLTSIVWMMPSSHLILSPPSPLALNLSQHQGLFNESAPHTRGSKYWSVSFSISLFDEYSGLISFRIDWFDIFAVQGTLKTLLQHHSLKIINSLVHSLLHSPTLTSVHDYWKNNSFD